MEISISDKSNQFINRDSKKTPVLFRKLRSLRRILDFHKRQMLTNFRNRQSRATLPFELNFAGVDLRSDVKFDITSIQEKYRLNVKSLCHVGAHRGQEVDAYIQLGIDQAIFIEPIPELFKVLTNEIKIAPNYKALNFAAGEDNRVVTMNLASNEYQSSSLLEPNLHLREAPNVNFNSSISVQMRKLDTLLEDVTIPELLIIDVQGYELNVLKGGKQALNKVKFIFIEVNRESTYHECAKVEEVDDYLGKFDYVRVLTRWWSIWGDAFYVKKELLPIKSSPSE